MKFTHQGGVFAVPDDRGDRFAGPGRVPDAPEGVVVDDGLDEGVKRRYAGDRGDEVPDRRSVHGSRRKACHGLASMPARLSGM